MATAAEARASGRPRPRREAARPVASAGQHRPAVCVDGACLWDRRRAGCVGGRRAARLLSAV